MTRSQDRRIDVEEAARIIFGTSEPNARQVGSVRAIIMRGMIAGSKDGKWTTTSAVAEYLASATLRRHQSAQAQDRDIESAEGGTAAVLPNQRQYHSIYRESLK